MTFSYPSRPDTVAIDDVTFDIAGGETLAIVGPSGAGKSTLFQLLLRFYDPVSGRILVDGVDISRVAPEAVRGRIGLVLLVLVAAFAVSFQRRPAAHSRPVAPGAFREYGIDVESLAPEAAAEAIRGRDIAPELVSALGAWARLRWLMTSPKIRFDELGSFVWRRLDEGEDLAAIAVATAMPAEGPSLGIAPSGKWT